MASTRERGQAVEARVAELLEAHGLRIVDRNVAAAGGEVDLVAISEQSDEPLYVFVEVRSRAADDLGSPLETVDVSKQRRVIRAATAWLVARDLWERVAVRFDVVGVTGDRVDWIRSAFVVAR
jgi:putative endonuclease